MGTVAVETDPVGKEGSRLHHVGLKVYEGGGLSAGIQLPVAAGTEAGDVPGPGHVPDLLAVPDVIAAVAVALPAGEDTVRSPLVKVVDGVVALPALPALIPGLDAP